MEKRADRARFQNPQSDTAFFLNQVWAEQSGFPIRTGSKVVRTKREMP
jgi:hypothetical protein